MCTNEVRYSYCGWNRGDWVTFERRSVLPARRASGILFCQIHSGPGRVRMLIHTVRRV